MNLAQVQAYLEDDVPTLTPPQPFAWWASKPVNPRQWLAPSEMKRYDVQARRESLPTRRRLGAFRRR